MLSFFNFASDALGIGHTASDTLVTSTPDRLKSVKRRSKSSSPQRPHGSAHVTDRHLNYLSNKLESVRKELKLKVNCMKFVVLKYFYRIMQKRKEIKLRVLIFRVQSWRRSKVHMTGDCKD